MLIVLVSGCYVTSVYLVGVTPNFIRKDSLLFFLRLSINWQTSSSYDNVSCDCIDPAIVGFSIRAQYVVQYV